MATKEEETLQARLIAAMAEMVNPVKDTAAYKYKYEQLDQVLGIIRPALLNHGLGLTQYQEFQDGESVLVTAVFDDTIKAELDRRPLPRCNNAQEAGSWETYMRRYALRTVFGLCGEDDDGAATMKQPKKPQPKAPIKKPKDLEGAKAYLWGACQAYAVKFGVDALEVAENLKHRQDYIEAPDVLVKIADELKAN